MLVSDLMSDSVITIGPDEPASLAARLFYRHNIGSVPVSTPAELRASSPTATSTFDA